MRDWQRAKWGPRNQLARLRKSWDGPRCSSRSLSRSRRSVGRRRSVGSRDADRERRRSRSGPRGRLPSPKRRSSSSRRRERRPLPPRGWDEGRRALPRRWPQRGACSRDGRFDRGAVKLLPAMGKRDDRDREAHPWQRQRRLSMERRRLRLEDWYLAVQLLLARDSKKTYTADDLEATLTQFLEVEAKKFHITPRLASELFLRGLLRTLWDVDRMLRAMNPGEELTNFAKDPLVLSILRVMAYELMWSPTGQDMAVRGVGDLMDKCTLAMKFEKSWISAAVTRMRDGFEKAHADWDRKREAHRESKLRARDEADDAEGDPHGPVPAARPKGGAAATTKRRAVSLAPARPRRPRLVMCAAGEEAAAEVEALPDGEVVETRDKAVINPSAKVAEGEQDRTAPLPDADAAQPDHSLNTETAPVDAASKAHQNGDSKPLAKALEEAGVQHEAAPSGAEVSAESTRHASAKLVVTEKDPSDSGKPLVPTETVANDQEEHES